MLSGASRTTLHRDLFSLCKVVQGVLRQHCRRFFPVQFCRKSKTRCHRIFSGALLSSFSRTALHRDLFSLCKVVPGALRHHCRRFFLWNLQINLMQHCTRKLLVQCQPRAYKHRFAGK